MTRYQLARLIECAGSLKARKRLQKVAYLLQAAGAPFDLPFRLHYYGPYSAELAALTDEMTDLDLLKETIDGARYDYALSEKGMKALSKLKVENGRATTYEEMEALKPRLKELLERPLRVLELAATIVYYEKALGDLEAAVGATCEFKQEDPASEDARKATELATGILAAA